MDPSDPTRRPGKPLLASHPSPPPGVHPAHGPDLVKWSSPSADRGSRGQPCVTDTGATPNSDPHHHTTAARERLLGRPAVHPIHHRRSPPQKPVVGRQPGISPALVKDESLSSARDLLTQMPGVSPIDACRTQLVNHSRRDAAEPQRPVSHRFSPLCIGRYAVVICVSQRSFTSYGA